MAIFPCSPRPRKRGTVHGLRLRSAFISNKLVHEVGAEAVFTILFSAHVDLSEDIFVTGLFAPRIYVDHTTGYIEKGDHFLDLIRHYEGMSFTRRLEHVRSLFGNPVVFQIVPTPAEDKSVYRCRMAVPGQNPGLANAKRVNPVTLGGIYE